MKNSKNLVYVALGVNEVEEMLTKKSLEEGYPDVEVIVTDKLYHDENTFGIFIEASAIDTFKEIYDKVLEIDSDIRVYIRFLISPLRAADSAGPSIFDIADQYYMRLLTQKSNVKFLFPFPVFNELGAKILGAGELYPIKSNRYSQIINPEINVTSTLVAVKNRICVNISEAEDKDLIIKCIEKSLDWRIPYYWAIIVNKNERSIVEPIEDLAHVSIYEISDGLSDDGSLEVIKSVYKSSDIYMDLNRYSKFSEHIICAQSYGCLFLCLNDNVLPYSERGWKIPYNNDRTKQLEYIEDELIAISREAGKAVDLAKRGQIYCIEDTSKSVGYFDTGDILYPYYLSLIKSMGNLDISEAEEDEDTE